MIIGFWGPQSSGMTLFSVALTYQQFLRGEVVMAGYRPGPGGKLKLLTREEFIRDMEEREEGK